MTHFVVVLPLSPLGPDESFTVADWPLHVTLVEPFTTERPDELVAAVLGGVAREARPISSAAGEPAMFGRRHDVPVTLIRDGGEISALRSATLAALATAGIEPGHLRIDFRPHVTVKRHGRLGTGDRVLLRQLALIDMRPSSGAHHRRVLGAWPLGAASVTRSSPPSPRD
ncbi:2'-5' RNA ligase family protein [Agromyces cerinus]|uniref:2'-5' RNA ligase superfamily protein n=1 Tax=Agromyces cerinus subsp. cerinus TaxID=232089 RepID=A0A1N6DGA8_9MICO|nr:2'-5' RNA ligase family protein [Agromyces cerinus]SIN69757.1 2'-5' RNA ligase superfamily protein [Agromyces cerinus subsp. cerinus]